MGLLTEWFWDQSLQDWEWITIYSPTDFEYLGWDDDAIVVVRGPLSEDELVLKLREIEKEFFKNPPR